MITTVSVHSEWFPVAGIARGSGVDYELALKFASASSLEVVRELTGEIRRRYGLDAYFQFYQLFNRAVFEGRLVIRRWRR